MCHSERINVPGENEFHLESIKIAVMSHWSYQRDSSEFLRDSEKFVIGARYRAPESRPAGVAEEEGTIRGQIKTRRVTVERVRNERVCDFGHAVRLYVDLRSREREKEGEGREREKERERAGEKEEKKERQRKGDRARRREETRERGAEGTKRG